MMESLSDIRHGPADGASRPGCEVGRARDGAMPSNPIVRFELTRAARIA